MARKCIHGANRGQCGYCGDDAKNNNDKNKNKDHDKPDKRGPVSWGPCGKCGKTIRAADPTRLGRMVASHVETHQR